MWYLTPPSLEPKHCDAVISPVVHHDTSGTVLVVMQVSRWS